MKYLWILLLVGCSHTEADLPEPKYNPKKDPKIKWAGEQ